VPAYCTGFGYDGGNYTPCVAFSNACGVGMNCSAVVRINSADSLVCKTPGTTAAGMPCNSDYDCVADVVCLPDKLGIVQNRCYALCDGTHACATGPCNTYAGLQVCR
jgi:hypothetical protein